MQRAARIAFVISACFAFVMASVPHPPTIPGQPPDKILHMLTFAALGGLAAYGFRPVSVAPLFWKLTAFGALIELVQAIPALRRDSDILDLLADMAAALVALLAVRWLSKAGER
jgi:VanZ family protein